MQRGKGEEEEVVEGEGEVERSAEGEGEVERSALWKGRKGNKKNLCKCEGDQDLSKHLNKKQKFV